MSWLFTPIEATKYPRLNAFFSLVRNYAAVTVAGLLLLSLQLTRPSNPTPYAPTFSLPLVKNGNTIRRNDFDGKILYLVFCDNACLNNPTTKLTTFNLLQRFNRKHFSVVMINGDPSIAPVTRALHQFSINIYMLYDHHRDAFSRYGVETTPMAFVIDTSAYIQYKGKDLSSKAFEDVIADLLANL